MRCLHRSYAGSFCHFPCIIQCHATFELREVCACRMRYRFVQHPTAESCYGGSIGRKIVGIVVGFRVSPFSSHIVSALEKLNMTSACTSCWY
jgi:hypothetical protein